MLVSSHPRVECDGAGLRAFCKWTRVRPLGVSLTIRIRLACTHWISSARLALAGSVGQLAGIRPIPITESRAGGRELPFPSVSSAFRRRPEGESESSPAVVCSSFGLF